MMLEGNIRDGVTEKDYIDLHVHSVKSDGTYTIPELVAYAAEKRLKVMALTDHDTVLGLDEIHSEAESVPNAPKIVNGVELSTDRDGKDIHIVGLFIDYKEPSFTAYLKDFRDSRDERNRKMCKKLREGLNMDISIEQLKERFPGAVITRAHYGRYMLENGYTRSVHEAFERWIGDDGPYFIPREKVPPEKGVELIRKARGIPVLAHPLLYKLSAERLEKLIASLKEAGLAAMETRYTTHSSSDVRRLQLLTEKYGLLESGGSDFHGKNKPDVDLAVGYGNLNVPYEIYEQLKEYGDHL